MNDLVSDFSAIHRIRDIGTLTGPAFFALAFRLAAYEGVIRARMREATAQEQEGSGQASPHAPQQRREKVPATKVALQNTEAFNGIFSFG